MSETYRVRQRAKHWCSSTSPVGNSALDNCGCITRAVITSSLTLLSLVSTRERLRRNATAYITAQIAALSRSSTFARRRAATLKNVASKIFLNARRAIARFGEMRHKQSLSCARFAGAPRHQAIITRCCARRRENGALLVHQDRSLNRRARQEHPLRMGRPHAQTAERVSPRDSLAARPALEVRPAK